MSWPFETSTPHVTAEEFLAYVCRRGGVTREQLALPPVMVGTFQNGSYARLVEQTAAALPVGLQPAGHPGGTGGSGQHGILVGTLPGTGRSIAVTRLSIGAPAAV